MKNDCVLLSAAIWVLWYLPYFRAGTENVRIRKAFFKSLRLVYC